MSEKSRITVADKNIQWLKREAARIESHGKRVEIRPFRNGYALYYVDGYYQLDKKYDVSIWHDFVTPPVKQRDEILVKTNSIPVKNDLNSFSLRSELWA